MVLKVLQKNAEGDDLAPTAKKTKLKVESKEAVVVTPAEELRMAAATAYTNLQRGWFIFAKKISEIRANETWTEYGYESFKDFCLEEYPDVSFGTISKFISVIESWGTALEQRLLKSPDEPLPCFDACYELTVHAEKLPAEELPKLRKSILERKISRDEVRARLQEFRRKILPEKTAKRLDRELKVEEARAKVEAKAEIASLDVVQDVRSETGAEQLLARIKLFIENLPALTKTLSEDSPKVIELAEFLRDNQERFNESIDAFLTRVEELSNADEE